jgi:acetyl-CoA carboxylase biotin carboxyl carrier protein
MAITSPLVGTVYLAPDPSSPPFVTPGASVQEGQTLLIVEAMKVMNPVRAPRTGIIKEICIENAAPVEFGETLLYLVA